MAHKFAGGKHFNKDRVANILVERELVRNDHELCKKWGITTKTLQNYQRRLEADNELSLKFSARWRLVMTEYWQEKTKKYLEKSLDNLEALSDYAIEKKKLQYMSSITDSVKVVGELLITSQAIAPVQNEPPSNS